MQATPLTTYFALGAAMPMRIADRSDVHRGTGSRRAERSTLRGRAHPGAAAAELKHHGMKRALTFGHFAKGLLKGISLQAGEARFEFLAAWREGQYLRTPIACRARRMNEPRVEEILHGTVERLLGDRENVEQVPYREPRVSADEIQDAVMDATEPFGSEDAIRLFDDASKSKVKELERVVEVVDGRFAQRTAP
jgi:hypothetical protein